MLPDDVLARLSQLNRETLTHPVQHAKPSPSLEGSHSSSSSRANANRSLLPAGREVETPWGKHYLIQRSIDELWPDGNSWIQRITTTQRRIPNSGCHVELSQLECHFPQRAMYLDLETCGFAGSMVFLIGLMRHGDGQIMLTQLLARDYSEEKAVLQTLWDYAATRRVLVTFNGKSFDWPMVHDRSTLHHLGRDGRLDKPRDITKSATREPDNTDSDDMSPLLTRGLNREDGRPELIHCDLLHHARRRWKDRLPNCKLQTLEQCVCGRRRSGDIPGRDIPNAYHDFVRTGDAWQLRSILHHNALDLITLLQLSLLVSVDTDSGSVARSAK